MAKGHKDKVAVITGAANGIGQAFAKRLAEDGVHIAIADIGRRTQTVKLVEAAGRQAHLRASATCRRRRLGRARWPPRCRRQFGRCRHPGQLRRHLPAAGVRRHDLRRLAASCCRSISTARSWCTSAFVPGMKQRGWGRIVNMASSTFGSVVTGFVHYVASKGGIVGFTRALATELGPHGITVNAIAPGLTARPARWRAAARRLRHHGRGVRSVAQMQAIKRSRCRTIWSARCRSSPATTRPSSPGRR